MNIKNLNSQSIVRALLAMGLLFTACIAKADSYANIEAVTVSGNERNYRFSVTIRSTETGCEQYANWWEVLNNEGELLYRRILAHSHVDEQPFTRSGSAVRTTATEQLYIRAHMYPIGYGGQVFTGSVNDGFKIANEHDSEKILSIVAEQPKTTCAF